MMLPNLSWMLSVGELRYIQSRWERASAQNPDVFAGIFLPAARRLACALRAKFLMSQLRARPFYHYLLARTKYYDNLFLDAVHGGVGCVINVGCGGDTRAYRFAPLLRQKGIRVFECDQAQAIRAKQHIAELHWPTDHVRYIALDLHNQWANLRVALDQSGGRTALVMMEGVSPYVRTASFEAFLRFLAYRLPSGSVLAYDFKIAGTADPVPCSVQEPFRLPAERERVAAYHGALGFELQHMELSSELSKRLVPEAPAIFSFDCLLRLIPRTPRIEAHA